MRHRALLLPLLLWSAVPAALAAQRPLAVGIAGGVAVPVGRLGDDASAGWRALGTLALSSPFQPLSLRLDGAYDRFALDDAGALDGNGALTVGSATLNVGYRLPMTRSPMSPYLITGLGAYRTACASGLECGATTRFGWNAGLGTKVRVLGTTTFIEARYHRTTRDRGRMHFVPVSVGMLF